MIEPPLCECLCVSRAEIEGLAQAGHGLDEIVRRTAAGTNCGACMPAIRRLARRARWRRRLDRLWRR